MDLADSKILVALATYNEIENLPALIDEIHQQVPDADILVVDDNSPDGTGDWCDQFAKENSHFRVIHRAGKLGLGTAARECINHAIQNNYHWLVTMDADWSHDPRLLPRMIQATECSDVVVGSRYCPGGRIEGWPWYRRWVSRLLNKSSCLLLDLPVADASGAFRIYRVQQFQEIAIDQLHATGYSYLEELVWHLHKASAKFLEVPIEFRDRQAGQSKANLQEVWGKLTTILRLLRQS